jgi:hypothetical protein
MRIDKQDKAVVFTGPELRVKVKAVFPPAGPEELEYLISIDGNPDGAGDPEAEPVFPRSGNDDTIVNKGNKE